MGRGDCSLCKYADPKYSCVWCRKQNACVYEKLCSAQQEDPLSVRCPNPEITDVSISNSVVITCCLLLKWKLWLPLKLVISSEKILTFVYWIIDWSSVLAVYFLSHLCGDTRFRSLLESTLQFPLIVSRLNQYSVCLLNCWCLFVADRKNKTHYVHMVWAEAVIKYLHTNRFTGGLKCHWSTGLNVFVGKND